MTLMPASCSAAPIARRGSWRSRRTDSRNLLLRTARAGRCAGVCMSYVSYKGREWEAQGRCGRGEVGDWKLDAGGLTVKWLKGRWRSRVME